MSNWTNTFLSWTKPISTKQTYNFAHVSHLEMNDIVNHTTKTKKIQTMQTYRKVYNNILPFSPCQSRRLRACHWRWCEVDWCRRCFGSSAFSVHRWCQWWWLQAVLEALQWSQRPEPEWSAPSSWPGHTPRQKWAEPGHFIDVCMSCIAKPTSSATMVINRNDEPKVIICFLTVKYLTESDNTTATRHLPWISRAPQSYRLCQEMLRKDGHSCIFTGPTQTNKQTWIHTLTYKAQDEKELGSILVETEVYRLRIHNGTDQVTFSCEKPWRWDDVYVREECLITSCVTSSVSGVIFGHFLKRDARCLFFVFWTKSTVIVEKHDKTLTKMLHRLKKRDLPVPCRQIWVLNY